MGNSGQIESTLLEQARGILERLKAAEEEEDFMMEWHKLGGLLELGYAPASGLSGETIVELAKLDTAAAEIFNARQKALVEKLRKGSGSGSGGRVLN